MYTTVDLLSSYLLGRIMGCIGPKQIRQGTVIKANLSSGFKIRIVLLTPLIAPQGVEGRSGLVMRLPLRGLRGGVAWS